MKTCPGHIIPQIQKKKISNDILHKWTKAYFSIFVHYKITNITLLHYEN